MHTNNKISLIIYNHKSNSITSNENNPNNTKGILSWHLSIHGKELDKYTGQNRKISVYTVNNKESVTDDDVENNGP